MLRATGFGRPLPAPWERHRRPGGPRTGFGTRPVRMAAGMALAALLLGNAVIVYRLMGEDTGSRVSRVPGDRGREDTAGASFKELREALQSVQASIKADVERVKPSRDGRAHRNDEPMETSSSGTAVGSTSTGSSSTGSSSTGSDSTGSDSGGGSGGSSGGDDTGSDDTSGGGPGGGGDTGGGGGDTGGGSSGGGGGGG